MKLKIATLLTCGVLLAGCASMLGVKNSKYVSEKIEIGMSKREFLKLFGDPFAKEMLVDSNNRPVERLLYQESLYDLAWYTLTTAFIFQDGKLIGQEIVDKRYTPGQNEKCDHYPAH